MTGPRRAARPLRAVPAAADGPAVPPAALRREPESGVAMLIVLVVLFIVAVLMVDLALTAETARRSARNASIEFLVDAAIEGRFHVVAQQLVYERKAGKEVPSFNDRWAREEFTNQFREEDDASASAALPRDEDDLPEGEDRVTDLSSLGITLEVTVEDEGGKFNLYALTDNRNESGAEKVRPRDVALDRLAFLIDRYREDTPLDVSSTKAAELAAAVRDYLERRRPVEGAKGEMPVPSLRKGFSPILSPEELRNVKGFEDSARGWDADFLLDDRQDPEEVRQWMDADDPDLEEPPYYDGLLRYVTLWSGNTWLDATGGENAQGTVNPETWHRINPNTTRVRPSTGTGGDDDGRSPVLETLFYDRPDAQALASAIVAHRQQGEDGGEIDETEQTDAADPLPKTRVITKWEDLKEVQGLPEGVADAVSKWIECKGDVFSIEFYALRDPPARDDGEEEEQHAPNAGQEVVKRVRWIVRRNTEGIQTLLREVRTGRQYVPRKDAPR